MVPLDSQEKLEDPDLRVQPVRPVQEERGENLDMLEVLDLQGHLEPMDQLEIPALLDQKEQQELQDSLVIQEKLERQVHQERVEREEKVERLVKVANGVLQETQVLLDHLDRQVNGDHLEREELQEVREDLVQLGHMELLDPLEMLATKDLRALQADLD